MPTPMPTRLWPSIAPRHSPPHGPGRLGPAVFAAAFGAAALPAAASPTVVTLDAPGGFVTACGGISGTTGAVSPGGDLQAFYLVDSHCEWQSFGAGTASAGATFSGGGATNSAQGTAGMGFAQLSASNSSTNDVAFPYGSVQAGWEDELVFGAPGLGGQPGIVQANLLVQGQWLVSGFAGAAGVALQPYINSASFTYPGGGGNIQLQSWNSSFYPSGVDALVPLTLPIVFGQPLDLGVFVVLRAGLRSVSGVAGVSSSDADFTNSISWQGITGVFAGGDAVIDYSVASASGVDWRYPVAVIPEPPVWLSLAAGLWLLALQRRHRPVLA